MLALDTILNESIWVAKMNGWRATGTYDEMKPLAESEDCRDFDCVCEEGQPEHLREWFHNYYEFCENNGWMTIPEYYKDIYLVDENEKAQKKVWTEEQIKDLIQTNDKVLYGALKKLYACQTEDEKVCKDTKDSNGVGFNSIDAPFLSSVAEFLIKKGFLTDKQKVATRKKLVKYNKQLTRLANA